MIDKIIHIIETVDAVNKLPWIVLGALIQYFYFYRRIRHAKLANLAPIVSIERSLAEFENADPFRFHGITPDDIKNAKIDYKELAYLVANFTAGRIYDTGAYHMSNKPFKRDNYRYKMLEQESTQLAWELVKRMMTEDDYVKKLEKTKIEIIKEKNKKPIKLGSPNA